MAQERGSTRLNLFFYVLLDNLLAFRESSNAGVRMGESLFNLYVLKGAPSLCFDWFQFRCDWGLQSKSLLCFFVLDSASWRGMTSACHPALDAVSRNGGIFVLV